MNGRAFFTPRPMAPRAYEIIASHPAKVAGRRSFLGSSPGSSPGSSLASFLPDVTLFLTRREKNQYL